MWSLSLVIGECSLSKRGHGYASNFYIVDFKKFRHSKSLVYRWYTQFDRRRFVYDTYKTMKATRSCHGWVHMFITHCPTVTSNFITSICSGLVVQVVSALLRGNWQDFNWHDASRGPSAIAELFVFFGTDYMVSPDCLLILLSISVWYFLVFFSVFHL